MNSQIFEKELLLTRVDFDRENHPRLKFADTEKGEILNFTPQFEQEITLEINTTQRFCIGWHSLETGEDFACPENSAINKKYEQCSVCQKRTGFNPAFYNTSESEISEQQQARNSEPHIVYLAYFTDEIIKVGISFAGRGIARLLEQGARAALILGEFKTANIARNYEEKIAKMPEFCENVKASAKLKLLENPFNFEHASKKLLESKSLIEKSLNATFDQNEPQDFSQFYGEISTSEIINIDDCPQEISNQIIFSGKLRAQAGYIWLAENQGETLAIALRKFTGYKIKISPKLTEIELPGRQASLFDF